MAAQLRWWKIIASVAVTGMLAAPLAVYANTPQPFIQIGRLWMNPEYDGAEGWDGSFFQYPGGIRKNVVTVDPATEIKRGWLGHAQKGGNYLFTVDWTGTDNVGSVTFDYASSYVFRSMDYSYPTKYEGNTDDLPFQYLYPVSTQEVYRWARPDVIVEGVAVKWRSDSSLTSLPVNQYDASGGGYRPPFIVDAELVTEMEVWDKWRFIQGVELNRTWHPYPYGTPHQDYLLADIELTNNGISGSVQDAPVWTNQTINKMIWTSAFDYRNKMAAGNAGASSQEARDTDALYYQPFGAGEHTFGMMWDGDDDNTLAPDWGDPSEHAFYAADGGMLLGNAYAMIGAVFASAGAGAQIDVDDKAQPAFHTYWYERGLDRRGEAIYTQTERIQRNRMIGGEIQLPLETSYRDYPGFEAIKDGGPGPTALIAYGPKGGALDTTDIALKSHGWDVGWGESVRIVQLYAAGGVDIEEGRRIAGIWNQKKENQDPEFDWMSEDDIALVQTGSDTAEKAASLAYWNFHGTFPSAVTSTELTEWGIPSHVMSKPTQYNQPFNVPDAPRPPGKIEIVNPQAGGSLLIYWSRESESSPNFDTGVNDFAGYRVYRQEGSLNAPWNLIAEGVPDDFNGQNRPGELLYSDTNVNPSTDYFYAVTAYNDGSSNWAEPGKSLESSRWYTWTGYAFAGVTAQAPTAVSEVRPGAFALAQNSPNPFNPSTTIRFSVPSSDVVKLVVYDLNGRMVRTLVDGTVAAGLHEISWDGADAAGRQVASGVYVYRLVGAENTITKRMTLVR